MLSSEQLLEVLDNNVPFMEGQGEGIFAAAVAILHPFYTILKADLAQGGI